MNTENTLLSDDLMRIGDDPPQTIDYSQDNSSKQTFEISGFVCYLKNSLTQFLKNR